MIDKRELLESARENGLPLAIMEKDYVLGWLLFGLAKVDGLVFKGGTALSKIYFPRIWRLSEDLDFAFTGRDFRKVIRELDSALSAVHKESGIKLRVKRTFSNPRYLQLKVQYDAVVGKNWVKVDTTKEEPVDLVKLRPVHSPYTDSPQTKILTESAEEIFAQKLRALLERTKCRDFYDVWKLSELKHSRRKLLQIFSAKCKIKGIDFRGSKQFLPSDLEDSLRPYWERELGRLIFPLPDMNGVLTDLSERLDALFAHS